MSDKESNGTAVLPPDDAGTERLDDAMIATRTHADLLPGLTSRSEEVRHQGCGLASIGGIRLAELGTHPLFLHAELDPEHEEDENENDEPSHLGDGNRHAKETGQNAGVDGVTDHGIRTGGDQLVVLLNSDGAAPVAAKVLARPDGEQKAGDRDGSSQPEGPKANRPELEVKPGQRDASCREEDDRDQENEGAQDARSSRLEALGGFGIGGFDLPVEKKAIQSTGKKDS
jgi:hypothetical protein